MNQEECNSVDPSSCSVHGQEEIEMTDSVTTLPPLTSEDNQFLHDILSLISAGTYIARHAAPNQRGTQIMEETVLGLGVDALRSRFLSAGIYEPDIKIRAGVEFMDKVGDQIRSGVSAKVVMNELQSAMERAGATFTPPPGAEPVQALHNLLEDLQKLLRKEK